MSRKRKYIVTAILIVIALLFIRSVFFRKNTALKIESAKVQRGELKQMLTISGQIQADERVILHFQTSGKLAWVGVKEGDYVKKYQTIASLDRREIKKKLDKILKDYRKTRLDFDQTKDDNPTIINDKIKRIVEDSQLDLDKSVIDVEIQNLALELSTITTPIEGLVVRVSTPLPGVNVTTSQAEFEIINPKTIYFEATADQTEVPKLNSGINGELVLDAYEDDKLTGLIKNISFIPESDETSTSYKVKFLINRANVDRQYRIGMTGDLNFILNEKKNTLYLPLKFVKSENNRNYVYQMDKDKKIKIYVKTGLETDDNIEIISNLHEADVVYD